MSEVRWQQDVLRWQQAVLRVGFWKDVEGEGSLKYSQAMLPACWLRADCVLQVGIDSILRWLTELLFVYTRKAWRLWHYETLFYLTACVMKPPYLLAASC